MLIENANEESKDGSVASKGSNKTPKHTLFIKNLSLAVEEEHIQDLFAAKLPSVNIVSIRLIRDKVDSSKRGIAFVDVASLAMAEASLILN